MNNITKVTVVRHGETEWNKMGKLQGWNDSPLTDSGIKQAKKTAEILSSYNFDAIFSSDLGRALQTANIIAGELRLDVLEDKRLRERNLGIFQGMTRDDIKKKYPEDYKIREYNDPDHIVSGGESFRQLYMRSVECFIELADRYYGGSILIVTHGGNLESIFRWVLSISLDGKRRFSLKNCSINRFMKINEFWKLDTWGR